MLKPERHIWEEGSTHRSVAGAEYDEVWDYADALEAELDGYKTSGNMTHLGITLFIKQLEAQVARLSEAIRQQQETADTRQCPCRLHFKQAVPEVFEEQEAVDEI